MLQEFFPILEGSPMGDLWVLLAWGLLIMVAWMFILWLWQLRKQDASIADFGWASGLAILGVVYAVKADGYGPRRWLIGSMVCLWGARLAWHILTEHLLADKPEDGRYAAMRGRWQRHAGIRMFLFFQSRAILALLLSIPFALLVIDPWSEITLYEWGGFALWLVALWGEWTSDSQLKHFKAQPENQGRVCQEGLWNSSRHPNYFFESLIWVAYFIAALETSYGAWTVICPLVMLGILFRGISIAEAHALQSRGSEYAEYQRTTSRFIPWVKTRVG